MSPFQFHKRRLSTNRISRTVQQLRSSYASAQLTVNIDIVGIDYISETNFGRNCLAAFVDALAQCDVRMFVDDSRREVFALCVDYFGSVWNRIRTAAGINRFQTEPK